MDVPKTLVLLGLGTALLLSVGLYSGAAVPTGTTTTDVTMTSHTQARTLWTPDGDQINYDPLSGDSWESSEDAEFSRMVATAPGTLDLTDVRFAADRSWPQDAVVTLTLRNVDTGMERSVVVEGPLAEGEVVQRSLSAPLEVLEGDRVELELTETGAQDDVSLQLRWTLEYTLT